MTLPRIMRSQNDWVVYPDTNHFVKTTSQGVDWWNANNDVAFVMDRLTNWYVTHIEKLVLPYNTGGQWSYAYRPIRGQFTGFSNHASATARDINAARNVQGKSPSELYSTVQINAIQNYLKDVPVIRWGGNYKDAPKDCMHWEINVTPTALATYVAAVKKEEEDKMPLNSTDLAEIKSLLAIEGTATTTAIVGELKTAIVPLLTAIETAINKLPH